MTKAQKTLSIRIDAEEYTFLSRLAAEDQAHSAVRAFLRECCLQSGKPQNATLTPPY